MTADQLRGVLSRQPFEPLTLFVTDGREFTIEHPDYIFTPAVGGTSVLIFGGGHFDFVKLRHITGVRSKGQPPSIERRRRRGEFDPEDDD